MSGSGSAAGLSRLSLPQDMMDVPGSLESQWSYDTAAVIPDKRLNRFFVHGTESDRNKIEDHLQVIDRENSIARLNTHGTPRMIRLLHANAEAVAEAIRDTYSGRIASTAKERSAATAASSQTQSQRNSGDQRRADEQGTGPSPESAIATGDESVMTLAVDMQSNSIVVTAPSQLADEVEKLIRDIDMEGRQSVHVIPLRSMDTLRVQESLKNLFGDQIRTGAAAPAVRTNPTPRTTPRTTGNRSGR